MGTTICRLNTTELATTRVMSLSLGGAKTKFAMSQVKSKFRWSDSQASSETVKVSFDGESLTVPAGITVAAALLGHDDDHFCSSAADGDARAPYCLMGVCFECLVEIDGLKNRQACLEPVYDGMSVKRQHTRMEE